MSTAATIIRSMNNKALVAEEQGKVIGIEEVWDSSADKRFYKIEYQSTPDGRKAIAKVLSNPWNRSSPNAGTEYAHSHISSNGVICLGDKPSTTVESSAYDLATAIKRGRLWCTVFSAWMEGGRRKSFNDIALGR